MAARGGVGRSAVLVTLGCSKNTVDSERIGGALARAGWSVRYDAEPGEGDVLILNTCGFIGDAKEESVGYILRAEAMLRAGAVRDVVVMGCLSERYPSELMGAVPGIARWYGVRQEGEMLAALGVEGGAAGVRLQSTPRHYAFLKIAEGCNRGCSFCAIPSIRGRYSSQREEQLVAEARQLAGGGVKELILIAQELTSYGLDLHDGSGLERLLWRLSELDGIEWIRLHYAYPTGFQEGVLEWMRSCGKACRYLDLPVQHISDAVLRGMNRQHDSAMTRELIRRVREEVPGVALRTSLIVGFPTEGAREFDELLGFVEESAFDHLGVFAYSEEEGTAAAARYHDVVPADEKRRRVATIMAAQQAIALRGKGGHVGRTLRVLIDEALGGDTARGRTEFDSPEVDGEVLVTDARGVQSGDFVDVAIARAEEYDLVGTMVGKS